MHACRSTLEDPTPAPRRRLRGLPGGADRLPDRPVGARGGAVEPKVAQVALCTADLPGTLRLFTDGLGFAASGTRHFWGPWLARLQGLGEDAAATVAWAVGRQDLTQLELFAHTTPPQRPLPADRRPSDLGWARFGVAVPDLDGSLARLLALGVAPLADPLAHDGLRRACIREPGSGVIVELLEEGDALPGGVRPRHYDLDPAILYAAVSVADLSRARSFFVDTIGLVPEPGTRLHAPEHEALWGLAGARSESLVLRGGDVYVELVRYDDPPGLPHPPDHRLSDQGFMNVEVAYRRWPPAESLVARVAAAGYTVHAELPVGTAGGTYVTDDQGTSLEIGVIPREYDRMFGFEPLPVFRHAPVWPRPAGD